MDDHSGGVFVQIDQRVANGFLLLARIDTGEDRDAAAGVAAASAERSRVGDGRRAANVGDAESRVLVK